MSQLIGKRERWETKLPEIFNDCFQIMFNLFQELLDPKFISHAIIRDCVKEKILGNEHNKEEDQKFRKAWSRYMEVELPKREGTLKIRQAMKELKVGKTAELPKLNAELYKFSKNVVVMYPKSYKSAVLSILEECKRDIILNSEYIIKIWKDCVEDLTEAVREYYSEENFQKIIDKVEGSLRILLNNRVLIKMKRSNLFEKEISTLKNFGKVINEILEILFKNIFTYKHYDRWGSCVASIVRVLLIIEGISSTKRDIMAFVKAAIKDAVNKTPLEIENFFNNLSNLTSEERGFLRDIVLETFEKNCETVDEIFQVYIRNKNITEINTFFTGEGPQWKNMRDNIIKMLIRSENLKFLDVLKEKSIKEKRYSVLNNFMMKFLLE